MVSYPFNIVPKKEWYLNISSFRIDITY